MKIVPLVLGLALLAAPVRSQPALDDFPEILRLQLDQHPAWRAYKDAVAEVRAEQSHAAAEAARLNDLTTPERLDALRAQLHEQEAELDRQARATAALYAVLSPEQRRAFDAMTRLPVPPSPMRAAARGRRWDANDASPQVLRRPPPGAALTPPSQ
jgi:hypothetical protein